MSNDDQVFCSRCVKPFASCDLAAHVAAEHLDYFPYGCAYCGNWLPTEELAIFHAQNKHHLPPKIKEYPNVEKERKLRQSIESSKATLSDNFESTTDASPQVYRQVSDASASPASSEGKYPKLNYAGVEMSPPPTLLKQSTSLESTVIVSPEIAVQALREATDIEKETRMRLKRDDTSMDSEGSDDTRFCNVCQLRVPPATVKSHVRKHLVTRPLAACGYCSFKARSVNGVRVHITWKHAGRSTKTGYGVKDLSKTECTYDSMFDNCFGFIVKEAKGLNPAEVCKSTGILRACAKRAVKSIRGARTAQKLSRNTNKIKSREKKAKSKPAAARTRTPKLEPPSSPSAPPSPYAPTADENPLDMNVGDICWAKIRGEPFWPSQIFSFNAGGEACILWLGTTLHGFVRIKTLEPFNETFTKRYDPKRNNKSYHAAVTEAMGKAKNIYPSKSSEAFGDKSFKQLPIPEEFLEKNCMETDAKTSSSGCISRQRSSGQKSWERNKFVCHECGTRVGTNRTTAHIYEKHMNTNILQCPHCSYGTRYHRFSMVQHMNSRHPDSQEAVIDRRLEPDMQELYIQWRNQCFPGFENELDETPGKRRRSASVNAEAGFLSNPRKSAKIEEPFGD